MCQVGVGFGIQNGDLKKETESLIVAAQNQSIRTNFITEKIDKIQKDTLCRLCKKADGSIDHVVSGCSKLAYKEYKRWHDNLCKTVHWKHARKSNFEAGDKWYKQSQKVFYRMKIIKLCGVSVFRLVML